MIFKRPTGPARTSITCTCGQRILAKDVVKRRKYLRLFGPNFFHLTVRCPNCKKQQAVFVTVAEWDRGLLTG